MTGVVSPVSPLLYGHVTDRIVELLSGGALVIHSSIFVGYTLESGFCVIKPLLKHRITLLSAIECNKRRALTLWDSDQCIYVFRCLLGIPFLKHSSICLVKALSEWLNIGHSRSARVFLPLRQLFFKRLELSRLNFFLGHGHGTFITFLSRIHVLHDIGPVEPLVTVSIHSHKHGAATHHF